ncbi:hypothetical protein [Fusibacter sp. JL216-2]|uniref:hypothetical protein n=1 Tax=Fusibacter sp. JL216-2 TaxID=3071453 RepID=UPI003D33C10B
MSNWFVVVLAVIFAIGGFDDSSQHNVIEESVITVNQEKIETQSDLNVDYELLEYGDLEEYLSYEFDEYNEAQVIEYIEDLNSKMNNCAISYKSEYSNEKYLIFEMDEIETTGCEQMFAIAWEVGNKGGGFILEPWIAMIDGFVYQDVLVVDYGTGGDRGKILYDLSELRENIYMDSLSVTSQPVSIKNTPWLLYQAVPIDYDCDVLVSPQSEIHMYNLLTKMTVIIRKAFGNTMWTINYDEENYNEFGVIKWTQEEDNNIEREIVETIDYDNQEYRSILENQIPLKDKIQYFAFENADYGDPYCVPIYRIESDYLCVYDLPMYDGVGSIVDNWEDLGLPEDTKAVIEIESEKGNTYIYSFIHDNNVVFSERLVIDNRLKYDNVLTVFEEH